MDKDIERMKLEIAANYFTSLHTNGIILYLSFMLSAWVALVVAYLAGQLYLLAYSLVLTFVFLAVIYLLWSRTKRFRKQMKYFDSLIEKLDTNQPLGTLEQINDKAP